MTATDPGSQPLTRTALPERTLLTLQRGGWSHPDVLLVDWKDSRAVVKDFAPRPAWVRHTLGRWLIRREVRTYQALAGHPYVPRFLGSLDALAFAVEHRPGVPFSGRRHWTFDRDFVRRLEDAVEGLHRRGVVHLDLRHRSNVRADIDGRPVLIDFGAALSFRPGSLAARWLLPLAARIDRRALRKWRSKIALYAEAGGVSAGGRGASRPTK